MPPGALALLPTLSWPGSSPLLVPSRRRRDTTHMAPALRTSATDTSTTDASRPVCACSVVSGGGSSPQAGSRRAARIAAAHAASRTHAAPPARSTAQQDLGADEELLGQQRTPPARLTLPALRPRQPRRLLLSDHDAPTR